MPTSTANRHPSFQRNQEMLDSGSLTTHALSRTTPKDLQPTSPWSPLVVAAETAERLREALASCEVLLAKHLASTMVWASVSVAERFQSSLGFTGNHTGSSSQESQT